MRVILVVDDDEDDKDFLCEAIHSIDSSINCMWVSDGIHAMKLLLDANFDPPDYIFLDLNMPRLGGKQCLSLIKSTPRLEHVPVIIYTTSKLSLDKLELKELGAVYFITKPTKIEELEQYVSFVLQGKWEAQPVLK